MNHDDESAGEWHAGNLGSRFDEASKETPPRPLLLETP